MVTVNARDVLSQFVTVLRRESRGRGFKVRLEDLGDDCYFVFVEAPGKGGVHVCVHLYLWGRQLHNGAFQQYGIYIEESERNRGLGTELMDVLVEGYRAIGLERVWVHMVINRRWLDHVSRRYPGLFTAESLQWPG